jgi:hypothetical protein
MYKPRTITLTGLILAAIGSVTLWAQPSQFEYRTIGPLETKTVTGAPYTATAITTFTQTLADGTHITRTIQAQLARDSEGRTRREETISAVGPWTAGGSEQRMVNINDPVAQTHYVLRPDQQVVVKAPAPFIEMSGMPGVPMGAGTVGVTVAAGTAGVAVDGQARKVMEMARTKVATLADNFVYSANESGVMVFSGADKKAQVEDLGDRVIEGVRAHGRQEKRTFAAGEIGNDRPIEVSSETWFSDELQTVVLSKRSDPRVGDNEYRLTNISRAEPAHSLFEVPAGFTVKDVGKRHE